MAAVTHQERIKALCFDESIRDGKLYHRAYQLPGLSTLASASLERGDSLPSGDEEYCEIIEAKLEPLTERGREMTSRVRVSVVARKPDIWANQVQRNTPKEMGESRVQVRDPDRAIYLRRFEVLKSSLTEGLGGWVVKAVGSRVLVVDGDASGVSGFFNENGTVNGRMAFDRVAGTYYTWWNSTTSRWVISTARGTTPAAWWYHSGYLPGNDSWTAGGGGATGTPRSYLWGDIPLRGDVYPDGTWTNLLTPVVDKVDVGEKVSVKYSSLDVTYIAPKVYSGASGNLWELARSRVHRRDQRHIYYTRRFAIEKGYLEEGAGGWVGTGASGVTLPIREDLYPYGVWTDKVTPRVRDVTVDVDWTFKWALVEVNYLASRVFGG